VSRHDQGRRASVTAVFAANGAHPYNEFLLWVNTLGGIGILALQTRAARAVLAFFPCGWPTENTT
jgi:hypothetical protein